jgi:hypothetical protein
MTTLENFGPRLVRDNRYILDIVGWRRVIESTHQRWAQTNPYVYDVG